MKRTALFPIIFVTAIAGAGGIAVAAHTHSDANDALADLAEAKISLTVVGASAEKQAGGRGARAELESERGATVFPVEVAAADKVIGGVIDSADERVRLSKPASVDRGEREHNND